VLLLTARSAVEDRVTGLQLGPTIIYRSHLPCVNSSRVRALGRRYPEEPVICLRVGDVTLDLSTHDVHRNTQRIELSPAS
jgi:Response regulators consisting of a CheY-like receiver domain and a winged-helix DNA-binding domain